MNDTITVIVPIHNKGGLLGKALRSLKKQTYKNLDILCIDDASTDNSYEELLEIAENDPRIAVMRNETNLGSFATRLRAIENVQGEFVTFCDADDIIEPEAIEKLHAAMVGFNVDLVQMRYGRLMGKLKVKYNESFNKNLADRRIEGEEFRSLSSYVGMDSYIAPSCWGKLYRTSLLRMVRHVPFQQFWGDDQIFNIPYLKIARSMVILSYIGYYYRWGGTTDVHYKFSALRDFKEVHRIKSAMGLDQQCLHEEIDMLLRYHVRQMHTEMGWTWDAVKMFLDEELRDPFWKEAGIFATADELIADAQSHVQKHTLKYIVKRLLK